MRRLRPIPLALVTVVGIVLAAVVYVRRERAPQPASGVPAALAESRAARVRDLQYTAAFKIPLKRDEPVEGKLAAAFTLADAGDSLAFDFAQPADRLRSVTANGEALTPAVVNGHVVIPGRRLVAGRNVIEFEFLAGEQALNRQDDLLYTLFVPARAALAMPVFDQPSLKGRWGLSLEIPAEWNAVANGAEEARATANGRTSLRFAETAPLPTYLVAFAAGRFSVDTAERNGRTFRMFHRENDAAKLARNRDAVFDLHAAALAWLEAYTAQPYAFGKFDFALIPSFQFGGMEHAGAVFYNASSLLLDESATQNQRLGRASLISHETAHMWFGDLVTMRWFNDVWMKEVFANFMAAKIVNPSFPEVNHELRFLYSHYPAAYDVDRTAGANPIRQELANLNEAGSLYGAIIYQKAPIMMRQLELLIGADGFREGLREYLRAHAMGNATWSDLVSVLDARTDVDLVAWSRAWVEERGRPRIDVAIHTVAGGTDVVLTQQDPMGRGLVWPQAIDLVAGYPGKVDTSRVELRESTTVELRNAAGAPPAWILPAGGGLAYGEVVLPPATLVALAVNLSQISDDLTRGAALVTLWESMLEGRMAPPTMLELLLAVLPRERNELSVSRQLGYLQTLFWRFTAPDSRPDAARRVERVLRDGLTAAPTTSLKSAWFSALRGTATTPEVVAWLESVWRRQVKIPGLPFSEADEAELALELAVRDVPAAREILETQHARMANPDRKARFAFVMPSVSSDPLTRDQFFASLSDVANRRREAWVLEGAGYVHHPLRSALSKRHVIPALGLVREIRDTGDIFFPKRWADATLGGYQSADTARDVRAFIDQLPPDYPARLKWVLLSAADQLFRAAKIAQ